MWEHDEGPCLQIVDFLLCFWVSLKSPKDVYRQLNFSKAWRLAQYTGTVLKCVERNVYFVFIFSWPCETGAISSVAEVAECSASTSFAMCV